MFAEIWCNSSSAEGREEEGTGVEISDQTAYLQWLKWLKKERRAAQLQGHRQIFLCFHVCTRQKVISYWSSTKRRHKSYKRPSGRIFWQAPRWRYQVLPGSHRGVLAPAPAPYALSSRGRDVSVGTVQLWGCLFLLALMLLATLRLFSICSTA